MENSEHWRLFGMSIDALESTKNPQNLLEAFKKSVSRFDFIYVGIGQLVNPAMAKEPLSQYGISDFPEEHTETYLLGRRRIYIQVNLVKK